MQAAYYHEKELAPLSSGLNWLVLPLLVPSVFGNHILSLLFVFHGIYFLPSKIVPSCS